MGYFNKRVMVMVREEQPTYKLEQEGGDCFDQVSLCVCPRMDMRMLRTSKINL